MFIVTFYSFKGGVGRTMALVNVAALLAETGNRVLLVDFDLEAPGLPSYGALKGVRPHAGILDYVQSYQEELVAPDVANYISRCSLQGTDTNIWLMSAGRSQKPEYSDQLNSMDWQYLYEEQSGYYMFEDLKNQWDQFEGEGFDYVLIDSRTGYTDVGGICTRQLPQSVVIMFMPTAQNIDGLVPVVEGIRKEQAQGKQIQTHFCASNLPDEYDEDDVVSKLLRNARKKLRYGQNSEEVSEIVIHHQTSLALLNDPLVVQTRRKSKLAKQYRDLRDRITADNLSDPHGARFAAKRILKITTPGGPARTGEDLGKFEKQLVEISRHHANDPELLLLATEAYRQIGNYEQVVASASRVIISRPELVRAYLLRGVAQMALDNKKAALQDLEKVLATPGGTTFEYRPAADLLRHATAAPIPLARKIFSNPSTPLRAKLELFGYLTQKDGDFDLVADTLLAEPEEGSTTLLSDRMNWAVLALIGGGRFDEAIRVLSDAGFADQVASQFNLAMAMWGRDGTPQTNRFQEITAKLMESLPTNANGQQCLALAAAVAGDRDLAIRSVDRAVVLASSESLPFSCWTYHSGPVGRFRIDLEKMKERIEGSKLLRPPATMKA
jgi:cellulose biosynthesis protein BcsQ